MLIWCQKQLHASSTCPFHGKTQHMLSLQQGLMGAATRTRLGKFCRKSGWSSCGCQVMNPFKIIHLAVFSHHFKTTTRFVPCSKKLHPVVRCDADCTTTTKFVCKLCIVAMLLPWKDESMHPSLVDTTMVLQQPHSFTFLKHVKHACRKRLLCCVPAPLGPAEQAQQTTQHSCTTGVWINSTMMLQVLRWGCWLAAAVGFLLLVVGAGLASSSFLSLSCC